MMDSQRFHFDTLTVLLANCFDDVESLLFEISEISDKGKLHAKWGNCQDLSVHMQSHLFSGCNPTIRGGWSCY